MGGEFATLAMRLADFGLDWLLQSTVLLVLGLAAGPLARGRGPAVQSALYRTILAAVLVCPIASALLAASGVDGVALPRSIPAVSVAAPIESRIVDEPNAEPMPPEIAQTPAVMIEGPRPLEATPVALAEAVRPTRRITFADVASWGGAAWILGSLILLARLAVLEYRMRRLRATAVPAEAEARALCGAIAARMNLPSPTVWCTPFLFSPCLVGLFRPAILLPEDVNENLPDAFVHELAHLARRDGLWNLARRLAVAVLWFQPLLWILSRRLETSAEEVCDDYVVTFSGDRARYAGLLVELAKRGLPPVSSSAVGIVSVRSTLARRVVRILDASRSLSTRAGRRAVLAMTMLGLASTVLAGLLGVVGRPSPAEEPKAEAGSSITGRIVDLEGRPVAGVVVKIEDVRKPKEGDLTVWLDAAKAGTMQMTADGSLAEVEGAGHPETITDAAGRFRLDGLEPERVVELSLTGATIAYTRITVVTRAMEPVPAPSVFNRYGAGSTTIQGLNIEYAAAPSHPVEGVVRDAKTGSPVADVEIRIHSFAGSFYGSVKAPTARTDARGRFQLGGIPRRKDTTLLIVPTAEQPYFVQFAAVPNPDGPEPIKVEANLHEGIWIEGRLTEQRTGKPIADAQMHYLPYRTNPFAQAIPEFGHRPNYEGSWIRGHFTTKADGSFRLLGLPGKAVVGAAVVSGPNRYMAGAGVEGLSLVGKDRRNRDFTYENPYTPGPDWPTAMKEIDPPADAKSVHVDLQAIEGDSVRVHVVDPDDRPISDLETLGRDGMAFLIDRRQAEPSPSDCEVEHLRPDEERVVLFRHTARGLGRIVHAKKGDDADGPVVVKLEPLATVSGRIVDAAGKAMRGVAVSAASSEGGISLRRLGGSSLSDADGRFNISSLSVGIEYQLTLLGLRPISDAQSESLKKIAVEPGRTTDVGSIAIKGTPQEAGKPPAPDVPITGRIVDLEGRPIQGALVTIRSVQGPIGGDLTAWLDAVKQGETDEMAGKRLTSNRQDGEARGSQAKTHADGRFRLEGVQADRVVELALTGETIAHQEIHLVTRATEPFAARGFSTHYGPKPLMFHGPDFTYTATPTRIVEGVVKDARTGRPIAGVAVNSNHFAGAVVGGVRTLETRTDAEGRFRIAGMPKGKDNRIEVVPATGQPYFVQEVPVPDPAGMDPARLDVALHEGIWIEGKVTEAATGKPIFEARLYYLPFLTNPFAKATPEFSKGFAREDEFRFMTKPDGSFRLLGLPGRAIVGAWAPEGDAYMQGVGSEKIAGMNANGRFETVANPVWASKTWPTVMKEIDPPADAKSVHVDLQATTGASVRLRIVDAEGNPVAGVRSEGRASRGSTDRGVLGEPDVTAEHLRPDERRNLMFLQAERKLGKVVTVHPGDDADGPVVVKLEPLATIVGRIADPEGKPVSGVTVGSAAISQEAYNFGYPDAPSLPEVASDANGRFVVPDVPIGRDYWLSFRSDASRRFTVLKRVVVKPGETTDVGEVRFEKK